MAKDPYLEPGRLPDLIAAIQVMATAGWGSLPIGRWVAELEGAEEVALGKRAQAPTEGADYKKWEEIFEQHREFFKIYTLEGDKRVALRWRFAQPVDYDPRTGKVLSVEELQDITVRDEKFYAQFTRKPLAPEQVDVLIKTAVELHSRVIAAQQDRRWLWPIVVSLAVAAIGLLAAYFKS
jgi:hypothetical protein